jgi:hypothetical protein
MTGTSGHASTCHGGPSLGCEKEGRQGMGRALAPEEDGGIGEKTPNPQLRL